MRAVAHSKRYTPTILECVRCCFCCCRCNRDDAGTAAAPKPAAFDATGYVAYYCIRDFCFRLFRHEQAHVRAKQCRHHHHNHYHQPRLQNMWCLECFSDSCVEPIPPRRQEACALRNNASPFVARRFSLNDVIKVSLFYFYFFGRDFGGRTAAEVDAADACSVV